MVLMVLLKSCVDVQTHMYMHTEMYVYASKIKLPTVFFLFLIVTSISRVSVGSISLPKFQNILLSIASQDRTMDMIPQNGHTFK